MLPSTSTTNADTVILLVWTEPVSTSGTYITRSVQIASKCRRMKQSWSPAARRLAALQDLLQTKSAESRFIRQNANFAMCIALNHYTGATDESTGGIQVLVRNCWTFQLLRHCRDWTLALPAAPSNAPTEYSCRQ